MAIPLGLSLALAGCVYRLQAPTPPSQLRLKVVASSPSRYFLRLEVGEPHDYPVPADGRVALAVPSYRAGCGPYLLDKIRVGHSADPFTAKTLTVLVEGQGTRQLSLRDIAALPVDSEGYTVLTLPIVKR